LLQHRPWQAGEGKLLMADTTENQGVGDTRTDAENGRQDLFFHAPVAGMLLDRSGRIKSINRQAAQLLLGNPDRSTDEGDKEPVNMELSRFVAEQDRATAENFLAVVFHDRQQHQLDIHLITYDLREIMVRLLCGLIPGDQNLCQMIMLDLETQQMDDETLNRLAYYDQLTGLPNRNLFLDRLHWTIRDARRQNEQLAVMMIDLDNFKQVNDTLGHDAGDKLLQTLSTRMIASLRESDTLSRLQGDEFSVLMQHIVDSADAATIAGRLLEAIRQPVTIMERPQQVNASIGVCLYPDDGDTADLLIHHADIAMYRSKNSGRNRVSFFSESLKEAVNKQHELESNLRRALKAHELEVWYQPMVDSATSRIIGLEALLRWRCGLPDGDLFTAGQFLPLAESLGLAGSFSDWAMQEACLQMKDWLDRGVIKSIDDCRMAVNVNADQLEQPELFEKIKSMLQTVGLPPSALAVEASETSLLRENQTILDNLLNLRKLGIALHLDDFSQGLTSLRQINMVPFDCLKIDQNCTAVFLESKRGEALLEALVNLSHNLGLQVIAEGVENQRAYSWFKAHACDSMQGYYFSRPMPAVQMEMLLSLRRTS
jgi:diguanylate cyclase (GGDEF)-like protein